jgi:hypothetical protein
MHNLIHLIIVKGGVLSRLPAHTMAHGWLSVPSVLLKIIWSFKAPDITMHAVRPIVPCNEAKSLKVCIGHIDRPTIILLLSALLSSPLLPDDWDLLAPLPFSWRQASHPCLLISFCMEGWDLLKPLPSHLQSYAQTSTMPMLISRTAAPWHSQPALLRILLLIN